MPEIIREDKQLNALQEIEQSLEVLRDIKELLSKEHGLQISASVPNKRKDIKVKLDSKYSSKARKILTSYHERISKEIKSKAATYRIALNSEEQTLLALPDGLKNPCEAEQEEEQGEEDALTENDAEGSVSSIKEEPQLSLYT